MPDDTSKKTVADRIKELRISQGLTQMDLAKKIGKKDKSSICKIEGKKNDITLKDVSRVAEALGTTPAYLMGWEEEEVFNEQLGELMVEIRRTPMLLKLIKEFLSLSNGQKTIIMNVIDNFRQVEPPKPNPRWDYLVRDKDSKEPVEISTTPQFDTQEIFDLKSLPDEHPSLLHTDNRGHN